MFSFFSRESDYSIVPGWATFFKPNEYTAFLAALDSYFKSKKMDYDLGDEVVTIKNNKALSGSLGLSNVSRACKQQKIKKYNKIVTDYFDALLRAATTQKKFNTTALDFESVKSHIAVRLYHKNYIKQTGELLVLTKPFCGDIVAMLVFDMPDSIINVQPHFLEKWNKSFDEVFKLGMENVNAKTKHSPKQIQLGEIIIHQVTATHFFSPNIIYQFENYPELLGKYGTLFSIPNRHSVLLHPINNRSMVMTTKVLIQATLGAHSQGPGPISNNLFWMYNNDITQIPFDIDDKNITLNPPENFQLILAPLFY
ncbi:MAG: hypothetical protein IPI65_05195 [Bacteroidetes bacterium]|nr:hypothetical protein [Bacteroidota bacterium]